MELKTILISKTIHLQQLYELQLHKELGDIKCIIDLSEFDFFHPIDIVQLSQIVISLKNSGCINISIEADFDGKHKYLTDIGLIEFCNSNFSKPHTIKDIVSETAMPIKRVSRENMAQYIESAQKFLSNVCPDKDLSILNIGLSELINNVYDHSDSPIGAYVFCQYYPNKKIIRFAVSDMGVGIPIKVNNFLIDRGGGRSDKECLEWAFEERRTIKSNPRNAGLGLHTIMSFVQANQGRIRLLSDKIGLYWTDDNARYFINPVKPFIGTVVDIEININNLNDIDVEEIDFDF